jgi:hypothetical protein
MTGSRRNRRESIFKPGLNVFGIIVILSATFLNFAGLNQLPCDTEGSGRVRVVRVGRWDRRYTDLEQRPTEFMPNLVSLSGSR